MPKIPLYNQGQGGTVRTATGALSPRANIGAFTAPGQAQAAFFQKAGQVAFQFGMAEKQAETNKTKRDVTTFVNQEMNNWTNENKDTTVEGYQASAQTKKDELIKTKLDTLRGTLTRRQFAEVSGAFESTFATKVAQGSQIAFSKNQAIRLESANSYLDNMRTEMSSLDPSSDLYSTKMKEVENEYAGFISQGLNPTLTLDGFKKSVDADNFNLGTDAAQTQRQLDAARVKNDARTDLSATEKLRREQLIVRKEAVVQKNLSDSIYDEILKATGEDLSEVKVDEVVKDLREGKNEYVYTNRQGQQIRTDLSALKAPTRAALISKLEGRRDAEKAEYNDEFITTVDASYQGMNLSQLVSEKSRVAKREGPYKGQDQSVLDSADSRIDAEIRERKPEALALASAKQRNIQARISSTGVVDEKTQAEAASVVATLYNADLPDQAMKFQQAIRVEAAATTEFKSIQFKSKTQTQEAISRAKANYNDNPTDENLQIFTRLRQKVEQRDKRIAEDFVGYYNEENPDKPLEPAELIAKQERMGVLPLDVRVTSNAELDQFKAQFNSTTDYSEKSEIGKEFLARYGENQNIVMRHLMTTGTISLVDNMLMAYPDQAFMRDVVTFNTEEYQKVYGERIKGDNKTLLEEAVRDSLGEYSNSILGGMAEGITQGGTDLGRASHVLGVMKVIENTAKGYVLFQNKSPEEAAQLAFENVIGKNYEFQEVNNNQIRFPSRTYSNVEGMADILNTSVTKGEEYLRTIFDPPPAPANASPSEVEALNDKYYSDLAKYGSWRTTTDNSGVYFIDGTGNIVPKKPDATVARAGDMSADPMARFATVSFDSLSNLEAEVRGFSDPESPRYIQVPQIRQKAITEFILRNPLF
jgi:hypothetical protein